MKTVNLDVKSTNPQKIYTPKLLCYNDCLHRINQKVKFAEFFKFKDDFDKFINLAKKGEDIIVTKSGKPILSLASISKEEAEDYILAKHYKLEKKAKSIESGAKVYAHKEVKKRLGL